jgi:SNF2 family DNA or RNA helicase
VSVQRDPEVPEEFWLSLRSEWGSWGRNPSRAVDVPVERFLSRRAWLAPACQRHRVGIDWDDASTELLRGSQRERDQLDALLTETAEPSSQGLQERLRSTRFTRELRDFQLRDLAKLLHLPQGANFSVPGAGKTAVTLALYELERTQGRVDRMLVVAPLSAFEAWFTEVERCFGADRPSIQRYVAGQPLTAEIVLIHYQRLAPSYADLASWVAAGETQVVLDEGHRMKRGRLGQWGTACLDLAYLAERRDVLTGTPAPQSPSDLEALLGFLWPNQALRILPPDALVPRPLTDAVVRTGAAIAPLFVRTTKSQLELPPVSWHVEQIPLSGIHSEIYAALQDQYRGSLQVTMQDRLRFTSMGRVTMYLLEAATNPALLPVGSSSSDPIEFQHPPLDIPSGSRLAELIADYGRYETPRKLIRVAEVVSANAAQGRKTLVWSNFVRNLEALHRMLRRLQPALVHGGIPPIPTPGTQTTTREDELRRFRSDDNCWVLLANPAAMSEGVSLHEECHDALYVERTFNAGQYLQSLDRIHRLGLRETDETNITFFITTGTVDEVVNARVEEKAERLSLMLRDPGIMTMALPDDEDYGPVLETDQDIEALLRHLRGDEDA